MSTPYHVKIAPLAYQQVQTLLPVLQKNLIKILETLTINPRPLGAKKINGLTGLYSENMSPLRLIYRIENQEILLLWIKSNS